MGKVVFGRILRILVGIHMYQAAMGTRYWYCATHEIAYERIWFHRARH